MGHIRQANKGTSTRDLADVPDIAYVPSGEGQWSRDKAHPPARPSVRFPTRPLTTRQMIEQHERKLRKLYEQHKVERDPVRIARIRRDIDAKQNFLAALWQTLGKELRAGR